MATCAETKAYKISAKGKGKSVVIYVMHNDKFFNPECYFLMFGQLKRK